MSVEVEMVVLPPGISVDGQSYAEYLMELGAEGYRCELESENNGEWIIVATMQVELNERDLHFISGWYDEASDDDTIHYGHWTITAVKPVEVGA